MIDNPGPWGTGPFILTEGYSRLNTEEAIVSDFPFAATWLWHQDRTALVRLVANTRYWDRDRGPHLSEVVFRNDLSPQQALDLVCTTEGEIDIVTEVAPADAERVEQSEHAKLVADDAMRVVAGVINRDAEGLPLDDRRARQALNLAIDRDMLVKHAMFGRARALAGLTPPTTLTALQRIPDRLTPYPHDADKAAELWRDAGGMSGSSASDANRPLRIAAFEGLESVAKRVAADIHAALGISTEVVAIYRADEMLQARRRLAERTTPREWDILIFEQTTQTADAPTLELHRAFVGETGEYRAGRIVPEFEKLWSELTKETSQAEQGLTNNRIDKLVYDEALALFLCAPQALYAVNRHVDFKPYHTSFELAECKVDDEHWSRR